MSERGCCTCLLDCCHHVVCFGVLTQELIQLVHVMTRRTDDMLVSASAFRHDMRVNRSIMMQALCVPVLQVPGSLHRMSPDRTVPIPIKLHLPFQPSKRDRERQQREREHRNSGSHLAPVVEVPEQELAQLALSQRPSATGSISLQRQSSGGCSSATSSRSLSVDPTQPLVHSKSPVVHQIVAGGNSSMFLTRAPEEIPDVYSINLLAK